MPDHTIAISEEERQMLILALALLSLARPGWDYAANEVALKFDNNDNGRAMMYDDMRRLNADREKRHAR